MAKFSKKIADKICELLSNDAYRVVDICKAAGIHHSTYYDWIERFPEFAESVKIARERYCEIVLCECEKSLRRLTGFHTLTSTETVVEKNATGDIVKTTSKTITKDVAPNLGAIIHTQVNLDPDKWANSQGRDEIDGGPVHIEITGNVIKRTNIPHEKDPSNQNQDNSFASGK